jgi:ribosome-binding protein aMBF1 (putative translation factor)
VATTEVVFYAEAHNAPALEWLEQQPPKVQDKFDYLMTLLEQEGHTLQRPHAAPLGEKVYELRVRWLKVHYRLLYFFHGSSAVLAHGCRKRERLTKRTLTERYRVAPASLRTQPRIRTPRGRRETDMAKKTKRTTSAREILRRRVYEGRPDRIAEREQTAREMALGYKIHKLREEAGWTQVQLAEKVGTSPSAISRIEDADYDGHSVNTLARVAEALGMMLIIDFERKPNSPSSSGKTAKQV